MGASSTEDRRQALRAIAVLVLLPGLTSVGQALWHLIIRDDFWGLAVAWKGGSGFLALWLSYWLWRRAERHRPSRDVEHEAD